MVGRPARGVGKDGGVATVVLLLVSRGSDAQEGGVLRVGEDEEVYRVRLDVPLENVGLRQVGGLCAYARHQGRFSARRDVVCCKVVG